MASATQATTESAATLREEILRKVVSERAQLERFGVRRLALFGSAVRNELRADSDLDFLVDLREETFRAYMGLKFFLEDVLGRKVDLVCFQNLKPRLRDRVLKEAIHVEGY
jgi:predicted nucleotidyltransferase